MCVCVCVCGVCVCVDFDRPGGHLFRTGVWSARALFAESRSHSAQQHADNAVVVARSEPMSLGAPNCSSGFSSAHLQPQGARHLRNSGRAASA